MQTHLQSAHKDVFKTVRVAQAAAADIAGTIKVDPKDETVRGPIPIFQLKNGKDRREFLKLVKTLSLLFVLGKPYLIKTA